MRHHTTLSLKLLLMHLETSYNLPNGEVLGTARDKRTSEARMIAMYICRTFGGMTYFEIANIFKRKHTTIMHACLKIKEKLKENDFCKKYNTLFQQIIKAQA